MAKTLRNPPPTSEPPVEKPFLPSRRKSWEKLRRELSAKRDQNLTAKADELRSALNVVLELNRIESVQKTLASKWQTLSAEQTSALRTHADISFRLLAKVMPDLKALDVTSAGQRIDHAGVLVLDEPPSEDAWIKAATGRDDITDVEVVEGDDEKP